MAPYISVPSLISTKEDGLKFPKNEWKALFKTLHLSQRQTNIII